MNVGSYCQVCKTHLPTEQDLWQHLRDTHNATFECSECHRPFTTKFSLQFHMAGMHPTETYNCTKCNKSINKLDKKRHEKNCKGPKKFLCSYCTSSFSTNYNKKRHEAKCKSKIKSGTIESGAGGTGGTGGTNINKSSNQCKPNSNNVDAPDSFDIDHDLEYYANLMDKDNSIDALYIGIFKRMTHDELKYSWQPIVTCVDKCESDECLICVTHNWFYYTRLKDIAKADKNVNEYAKYYPKWLKYNNLKFELNYKRCIRSTSRNANIDSIKNGSNHKSHGYSKQTIIQNNYTININQCKNLVNIGSATSVHVNCTDIDPKEHNLHKLENVDDDLPM